IKSRALSRLDSLYSIVQIPAGVSVATMAIGEAGAKDAALFSLPLLANTHENLYHKLLVYRAAAQEMVEESNKALL
ncbi:AIR carboxylase family protein, partial [Leuconostoc mesenteroides]|uniref:AIR carboxylase family protein n=1 Tax=Leuconostoc mesenteroides TaxID=1245 RepID=UPI001CBA7737